MYNIHTKSILLVVLASMITTACAQQQPAAVERKEKMHFGRKTVSNTVVRNAYSDEGVITSEPIIGTEGVKQSQLMSPQRMVGEPGVEQQYNAEPKQQRTLEEQLTNKSQSALNTTHQEKHSKQSIKQRARDEAEEELMEEVMPDAPIELKQQDKAKTSKVDSQTEPGSKPSQAVTKVKGGYKTVAPMNDPNYAWPAYGQIVSRFQHGKNEGINIALAKGASIAAAADGEVVYVGEDNEEYGKMLIVKHPGNIFTAYAHADKITVSQGAKIRKGQVIASAGQTGSVDSPQLYFSVRKDDDTIDPELPITN